jgi:hypothetical protein
MESKEIKGSYQMKYISYALIFIFLISIVSATVESLPVQKKAGTVNLIQSCAGSTYSNITKVLYPNSSFSLRGEYGMTKSGNDYNYSFNDTQTLGRYLVYGHCDQAGTDTYWAYDFTVTYMGDSLDTSKSIMYIGLLALMVSFFILVVYFIEKIPSSTNRNEEGEIVSLSGLKYLGSALVFIDWMILIGIFYISSSLAFAYLGEVLFAKVLFMIYSICFRITPLIVILWFVWIFVSIFQDQKMRKLIEKGLAPGSNI